MRKTTEALIKLDARVSILKSLANAVDEALLQICCPSDALDHAINLNAVLLEEIERTQAVTSSLFGTASSIRINE